MFKKVKVAKWGEKLSIRETSAERKGFGENKTNLGQFFH